MSEDSTSTDEKSLQCALDLARKGIGLASPGPLVGALIADAGGNISGSGFYTYGGVKHAEIMALEEASGSARDGTLYINLEPHAHHGRTPPCTDALIKAGIRRVVASMEDPNPRVSGRGFEQLRAAGIQVAVGGLQSEARRLNEGFAKYVRCGLPLVTLKSAMTLDAKIGFAAAEDKKQRGAPTGGWITGQAARSHVQEQRHASDAILVGVGTVLADDPLLNDRSGRARRRPLLRVVLDSHLRLPLDSKIVRSAAQQSAGQSDLLIFCSSNNASYDHRKKDKLQSLGTMVEQVSDENGFLDFRAVIKRLGELQIASLIIEGGSTVNRIALACGIVDKVFLYYAPRIAGDAGSIPFLAESNSSQSQSSLRLNNIRLHQFGEDVAIEGYLRDPYKD